VWGGGGGEEENKGKNSLSHGKFYQHKIIKVFIATKCPYKFRSISLVLQYMGLSKLPLQVIIFIPRIVKLFKNSFRKNKCKIVYIRIIYFDINFLLTCFGVNAILRELTPFAETGRSKLITKYIIYRIVHLLVLKQSVHHFNRLYFPSPLAPWFLQDPGILQDQLPSSSISSF
jgi:hypothetical protein